MKSAVIKFEEEQQKKLNKYQASQELETGIRPNYSEVFFRGLECLSRKPEVFVADDQSDSVKRLRAELESSDAARSELAAELKKAGLEIEKLKAERKAEENPSLAGSENIVLRKKIAELESELKAKPVSADARQMKMLSDAALKADEEIARLKAEIVRKDFWFEHTPMEDKAKKGWVMYFQLKKSMEAKGQFDQEAAS